MAKGFSFVLVTVVMVMMMVFGMLSMSSAHADLRLSAKAAAAQTTYYQLDSDGEKLRASCAGAAADAWAQSKVFVSAKQYQQTLPVDFYSCLQPLVTAARANPGSNDNALTHGVFFYFLEQQLNNVKGDYNLSFKVDYDALSSSISTHTSGSHAMLVYATIKSQQSANNSLSIVLACDYSEQGTPVFQTISWQSSVSGLTIDDNQKIRVFGS